MGFDLRYLFCPIREQASAEAKGNFENTLILLLYYF